jgi:hypothetical protein
VLPDVDAMVRANGMGPLIYNAVIRKRKARR